MANENTNQFTVDGKDLQKDIEQLKDMKSSVSEATGELRSQIKAILDNKGYHSKALAIIRDLDAMSETKRADVLRTFTIMFEAMMELKWRKESADMLEGIEDE